MEHIYQLRSICAVLRADVSLGGKKDKSTIFLAHKLSVYNFFAMGLTELKTTFETFTVVYIS